MKKKHIIYTLSTIPLAITIGNVSDSDAFFRLDTFITKNRTVSDVVDIKDENLLKAINNQLGRGNILDSVTIADMESLTILNAYSRNISSIDGLEYATNLTELYLYDNNISSIEPLKNLVRLKKLYLGEYRKRGNLVTDISPLRNLIMLKELHLGRNNIDSLKELNKLVNLTHLYVDRNNLNNLDGIETLINLEFIDFHGNNVSNIEPLINLTKLTHLYGGRYYPTGEGFGNNINNITGISKLINLECLNLGFNKISDAKEIFNLKKLKVLNLYFNNINDISGISNLSNLIEMSLHGNKRLYDINEVSSLTNLINLNLGGTGISDVSDIISLKNLKMLHLHNSQITDITGIDELTNLEDLKLDGNKISDISPVRNLKNLIALNLSNQKPIIDVGDFKSETNTLDISINNPIVGLNNRVSNISSISNNGIYENGKLKWNNLPLGNHARTFNFSENITIGSATATFNGTATLNFNVVDGGAPETDHTSEFDSDDFGIYTTVTANDLGTGVDYLMHGGVRQSLPYRFKYDIYNNSNNLVEVYDLVGNKAEYQVKLKDSDIPTIEEGLDALVNKSDSGKEDISYFRKIINDLDESMNKDLLQNRLNDIYPKTLTLDRELTTSNMDVYIKSENILQMSLDTNSISFDNFSGIEDVEKLNAVNLTINSSLPYQLNAYLPTEIQNSDKSKTLDKSILNIKESSSNNYQTFTNTSDKIILKDNCSTGNYLAHGVDLKLVGGIAHEKDVYKAIIKLEAEQK